MEMPSLEEEATMSEPFYGGEWASEMENWYPADDDDTGWPYPDHDNDPADNDNRIREGIYAPGDNDPTEPEDWRHGEPAGDEGWSE